MTNAAFLLCRKIYIKTGPLRCPHLDLSKLEFVVGDFHVFWLREFVFECRYEFWINLSGEGSYLFDSRS